jgi:hypothetical protein
MLLTTGNKSEMAVGYATLYGDMAGGFAPIKDCSKLLVYKLAEYRNKVSPVIPARVIERPPSAELRPDQKDSDSLPPYEVLDPILEAFIEDDLSVDEICARGFDRPVVVRVLDLVKRNEYKRRQAPPGVRVSRRAIGRDWRYPHTSGYRREPRAREGRFDPPEVPIRHGFGLPNASIVGLCPKLRVVGHLSTWSCWRPVGAAAWARSPNTPTNPCCPWPVSRPCSTSSMRFWRAPCEM